MFPAAMTTSAPRRDARAPGHLQSGLAGSGRRDDTDRAADCTMQAPRVRRPQQEQSARAAGADGTVDCWRGLSVRHAGLRGGPGADRGTGRQSRPGAPCRIRTYADQQRHVRPLLARSRRAVRTLSLRVLAAVRRQHPRAAGAQRGRVCDVVPVRQPHGQAARAQGGVGRSRCFGPAASSC